MKKLLSLMSLVVFCLAFSGLVFAQNNPDWLKRVEVGAEFEKGFEPLYYLQTVQPIQEMPKEDSILFYQPRAAVADGDPSLGLVVGYRTLQSDKLLGGNVFLDYQKENEHFRAGVGLEMLNQIYDVRFNAYLPVSTARVAAMNEKFTYRERIAQGCNLEVGVPLPYVNWIRFYAGGFYYNHAKAKDLAGTKFRLEAKLRESVTLEIYGITDNHDTDRYGGRLRFTFAFDKLSDLKEWVYIISADKFIERDLNQYMLAPAERFTRIELEDYSETR